MHEQETIPHKDNQSLPDETVVPPGQSGVEQTDKQVETPVEDFNKDGKPIKLPVENAKFDVRM